MSSKTRVNFLWVRTGASLRDVKAAALLVDDMAGLSNYFRDLLRKKPDAFDSSIELEGFAPVRLSFKSLCQTVGMAVVHPYTAKTKQADAICLLVNGLEGPEDIATVKAAIKLSPHVWKLLSGSQKPVVMAVLNTNGRMRDPATITTIQVLGNAYFNMFGTNTIEDTGGDEWV